VRLMGAGRSCVSQDGEGTAAKRLSLVGFIKRRAPLSREITGDRNLPGALLAIQHNRRDQTLKTSAAGAGLVDHAGAVLLRKAAGQSGLASQLSAALRRESTSPLIDRGSCWARMHQKVISFLEAFTA
jgi:hypothetical protein